MVSPFVWPVRCPPAPSEPARPPGGWRTRRRGPLVPVWILHSASEQTAMSSTNPPRFEPNLIRACGAAKRRGRQNIQVDSEHRTIRPEERKRARKREGAPCFGPYGVGGPGRERPEALVTITFYS